MSKPTKIESFVPVTTLNTASEEQLQTLLKNFESAPNIHSSHGHSPDNMCWVKYDNVVDNEHGKGSFYLVRRDVNSALFFNEGVIIYDNGNWQRGGLAIYVVLDEGGELPTIDVDFEPKTVAELTANLTGKQIINK